MTGDERPRMGLLDAFAFVAALFLISTSFGVLPVEMCHESKYTAEEICALHSVGFRVLLRVATFLDEWSEATVAFATLIVAWFTGTLWRATSALKDASDDQLSHSRDSAARQLRAYVAPSTKVIKTSRQGTIWCEIGIMNFGRIPAHAANVSSAILIIEPPVAGDIIFSFVRQPWNDSAFTIHPGQCVDVKTRAIEFSQADLTDISSGKKAIWVSGKITYNDGFAPNRETEFLYWATGKDAIDENFRLYVYRSGNRAT